MVKSEGRCKNAMYINISIEIFLLEPLLINSTRSTKKNKEQLKNKISRIDLKLFFSKYFKINCVLIIEYFYVI